MSSYERNLLENIQNIKDDVHALGNLMEGRAVIINFNDKLEINMLILKLLINVF